ncbi:radical SAM protein [Cohnella faecalis]|uniref:Radical SAM protein n=1 Tax=Cohnella faecalis TaxID=2315694 RepID=A0A398CQI0_9BACL|nr:radical SAM protein [Cohnella faecalis]RIE04742.1 radical SAM protein [Cohnella faecalis]
MAVELRPLGVACNISCHYCYQNPQREAGNVPHSYDLERMKKAVEREGGPFTLFGGEALLIPIKDLEELFRWGQEKYGHTSLQTNGVLIDDERLALFKKYNVYVGVSIDGPDELNDLRWQINQERTRRSTERTIANIIRLCREHRPPGLIVTLHRINASAERLPRLHEWIRELDAHGIRSVRLHLLESETESIREKYGLTDEENVQALLGFAELQKELKNIRFDVLDEMERGLMGRDGATSCVWHACDPYSTMAVRGVEGNGQSSNCGRTNKDGIDFIKADKPGFERYTALYNTPQEEGGCKGCRFFLMCKGQCPGTAIDGDWRNRSELCEVWTQLFIHAEKQLIASGQVPLSIDPRRPRLERQMVALWKRGKNSSIQQLLKLQQPSLDDLPDCESMEKEASSLERFFRFAFVGESQRAVWAPRLTAIRSALARIEVLAVAKKMANAVIVHLEPAEVFQFHQYAAEHGLHCRLLNEGRRERWARLIVGSQEVVAAGERWTSNATESRLPQLPIMPICCRQANEERLRAGIIDPVWHAAASVGSDEEAVDQVDVKGRNALNPFLRPLGANLLGYQPCSFACEESRSVESAKLALGREAGLHEEMDWLEEMLQWPVEWKSLHGIAEVKTGILRYQYHTDYSSKALKIRYHGSSLASDAAQGLSFAYRRPRR